MHSNADKKRPQNKTGCNDKANTRNWEIPLTSAQWEIPTGQRFRFPTSGMRKSIVNTSIAMADVKQDLRAVANFLNVTKIKVQINSDTKVCFFLIISFFTRLCL